MERISFFDFEKGLSYRLKNTADSVKERNEKEFLEELDKTYLELREKYRKKYEFEVQEELTSELIQLAEDIHCFCEERMERMENNVLIRIG